MKSQNLIIEAGQRIRDEFFAISNSRAFSNWVISLDQFQITSEHLELLTGVGREFILEKKRAGDVERNPSSAALKPFSHLVPIYRDKALNVVDHPADEPVNVWGDVWLERASHEFVIKVLSQHVDSAPEAETIDAEDAIFLRLLGRKQGKGKAAFWARMEAGELMSTMIAEVEQSDEYKARHGLK